jgi:membrane fusion protein (multidrug efflux system)
MGRKSFFVTLAIAVMAGGGAYYFLVSRAGTPAMPDAQAARPAVEKATVVEAQPVAIDTVIDDIRAVGSLRPNEAVVISSEIAGRVERIRFKESDQVAAGDVLVELDSTILRAELRKAESDLTLASANRHRAVTLARQGTGTLRARDEGIAAHQAAQANVELARARLEKASITAPFSGVVGLRAVSAGAYVRPGDRLVELADIDPIKVDFRVPELALTSLRAGQPIRVTVDAVPGRTFDGAIYAIDPIVDATGRAVRVRAQIANPSGVLAPGLFARVQIVVERRANSVLVPESAIFARDRKRYVYRVVKGRAVLTEIELGQRRPGQAEVTRGLERGAVVVTAGHQKIRDGALVEVTKPRAAG